MPPITRVQWSASNLPAGLTLNPTTGIISGCPTVAGDYTVPVTVATNWGSATKNISISVESDVEPEAVWTERTINVTNISLGDYQINSNSPRLFYDGTYVGYRLMVPMSYTQAGGTLYQRVAYSNSPSNGDWEITRGSSGYGTSTGTGILDLAYDSAEKLTYVVYKGASASVVHAIQTSSTYTDLTLKAAKGATTSTTYAATCYSSSLKTTLYISTAGKVYLFKDNARLYQSGTKTVMSVNEGCAAWSTSANVFCIAGPSGTATSSDGQTWTVHSSAPRNIVNLEYRSGIGKFVARVGNTFYSSSDGITWTNMFPNATLPSSVSNIKALKYSDSYDLYCLISSASTNAAYFSRDLQHWKKTTVTENAMAMGDVIAYSIYFILIPTSGLNYYMFSINQLNLARCDTWQDI